MSREKRVPVIGEDGRVLRRNGRWRFLAVYGKRCRYCLKGILWMRRPDRGQIPVEPSSWDGEEWYVTGKNRYHGHACIGTREHQRKVWERLKGIDPELVV